MKEIIGSNKFKSWAQLCSKQITETAKALIQENEVEDVITSEIKIAQDNKQFNNDNSLIHHLPTEIKMMIFEYMQIEDILKLSAVCVHFYNLLNADSYWKSIFERDQNKWKAIGNPFKRDTIWKNLSVTFRDYVLGEHMAKNQQSIWKKKYMTQYFENNKDIRSIQVKSGLAQINFTAVEWRSPFQKKIYRVPMFGEGMEFGASKKFLYTLLWSNNSPFNMTRVYPGIEGIGSGFGFKIGGKEISLSAMYMCEERNTFSKIRPVWREFFKSSKGFVYVVDPSNIEKSREEIENFIREEWIDVHAPLLVVMCTDDLPESPKLIEVAEKLGLNTRKERNWCLRSISVNSFEGIVNGMNWLAANL